MFTLLLLFMSLAGVSALPFFFKSLKRLTSWLWAFERSPKPFSLELLLGKRHERDSGNVNAEILDKYQVLEKFPVGSWQRTAFDGFVYNLTSKRNNTVYPCIYGTKGYKDNSLVYLFLTSPNLNDRENVQLIAKAVDAYVPSAQAAGLISSMVIIAPNSDELLNVQGYQTMFWNFLRSVRKFDTKPWPQEISKNPLDSNWSFCFAGEPAFIVVCTPAHENRHSRWMPNLCLVYQPRWIFDIIMDSATKRKTAVKTIRNLVDKFDHPLSHSPDLANFGEPDTTESRQLYFLDENVTAVCPFDDLEQ